MQTWSSIHPFFMFLHICRVHDAFLICIGSSPKQSFVDQVKVNSKWPNGQLKLVNSNTLCELIQMSIEGSEGFLGIFFGRVHFSKLRLDDCIKVVFMKSNKETARFLQDHTRWFCFFYHDGPAAQGCGWNLIFFKWMESAICATWGNIFVI